MVVVVCVPVSCLVVPIVGLTSELVTELLAELVAAGLRIAESTAERVAREVMEELRLGGADEVVVGMLPRGLFVIRCLSPFYDRE